jgi:prevent-host-death family protein
MNKIIPITDLQRQAGQIVSGFDEAAEPVIITQRGRAAAVLMPVARYQQMEEDLARLDELELRDMLATAESQIAAGETISHQKVKERIEQRKESVPGTKEPGRRKRAR